jgi:hypothetical protein
MVFPLIALYYKSKLEEIYEKNRKIMYCSGTSCGILICRLKLQSKY